LHRNSLTPFLKSGPQALHRPRALVNWLFHPSPDATTTVVVVLIVVVLIAVIEVLVPGIVAIVLRGTPILWPLFCPWLPEPGAWLLAGNPVAWFNPPKLYAMAGGPSR
jgi:hypothetical protein